MKKMVSIIIVISFLLAPLSLLSKCPNFVLENRTNNWTERDEKTLKRVIKRCEKEKKCLSNFIKVNDRYYYVICKKMNKRIGE